MPILPGRLPRLPPWKLKTNGDGLPITQIDYGVLNIGGFLVDVPGTEAAPDRRALNMATVKLAPIVGTRYWFRHRYDSGTLDDPDVVGTYTNGNYCRITPPKCWGVTGAVPRQPRQVFVVCTYAGDEQAIAATISAALGDDVEVIVSSLLFTQGLEGGVPLDGFVETETGGYFAPRVERYTGGRMLFVVASDLGLLYDYPFFAGLVDDPPDPIEGVEYRQTIDGDYYGVSVTDLSAWKAGWTAMIPRYDRVAFHAFDNASATFANPELLATWPYGDLISLVYGGAAEVFVDPGTVFGSDAALASAVVALATPFFA